VSRIDTAKGCVVDSALLDHTLSKSQESKDAGYLHLAMNSVAEINNIKQTVNDFTVLLLIIVLE